MELDAMRRMADQNVSELSAGNMTLGQMIALLGLSKPESTVSYDFGGFVPTGLDSYRGFYNHLCLEYKQDGEVTVEALLTWCRQVDGKVLTGYKGGEFRMDKGTPLWAANYSECHGTAIVGIRDYGYHVKILTGYVD